MRLSSFFPLLVPTALIPHAYAWGAVGHEIVATIAQMHLHPTVMPKLCEILHYTGECHLAPVATWADRIRALPKYRWTGPLHYIGAVDDYPSSTCAFPGEKGWEGRTNINVLSAIRNTTGVLQEFEHFRKAGRVMEETEPGYVQDALKFLIHFVGDMHQPLHLTGRDRGGNGDRVAFDGHSTNLHTVWDSRLISERLRTLPHNYTKPLPLPDVEANLRGTIYDPYIRRLVWEGLLGKWQDDLDEWLACPSTSTSTPSLVSSVSASAQSFLGNALPTSIWRSIFTFFSSAGEGEGQDGLGVDDDTLCPYSWAKPIHQLNCDVVFPKALDELSPQSQSRWFMVPAYAPHDCDHDHEAELEDDIEEGEASVTKRKSKYLELNTPAYAGRIKREWIVEMLLTKAGVRLAGVLNWIFADLEEGEIGKFLVL